MSYLFLTATAVHNDSGSNLFATMSKLSKQWVGIENCCEDIALARFMGKGNDLWHELHPEFIYWYTAAQLGLIKNLNSTNKPFIIGSHLWQPPLTHPAWSIGSGRGRAQPWIWGGNEMIIQSISAIDSFTGSCLFVRGGGGSERHLLTTLLCVVSSDN